MKAKKLKRVAHVSRSALIKNTKLEDSKDLCSSCGCRTDSIMQGKYGAVCESCLENEENAIDDQWN